MNPRKARELLPKVAEETGIDLQCLKDLTDFYWSNVHKELTSLTSSHVMIPHLGTFSIKNDKLLLKTIARYERLVTTPRKKPPKTLARYALYKKNEEILEKLYKLLDNYNFEQEEKKRIKQIRKDVRDAKENLGKQESNPGGDDQLSIHQT